MSRVGWFSGLILSDFSDSATRTSRSPRFHPCLVWGDTEIFICRSAAHLLTCESRLPKETNPWGPRGIGHGARQSAKLFHVRGSNVCPIRYPKAATFNLNCAEPKTKSRRGRAVIFHERAQKQSSKGDRTCRQFHEFAFITAVPWWMRQGVGGGNCVQINEPCPH